MPDPNILTSEDAAALASVDGTDESTEQARAQAIQTSIGGSLGTGLISGMKAWAAYIRTHPG